jgi:hypothetical protein
MINVNDKMTPTVDYLANNFETSLCSMFSYQWDYDKFGLEKLEFVWNFLVFK